MLLRDQIAEVLLPKAAEPAPAPSLPGASTEKLTTAPAKLVDKKDKKEGEK